MELEKEECRDLESVLSQAKKALLKKNSFILKDLSNRTIHSSCSNQDEGSITTAVLIYTLGKLIEREDYTRIKSWDKFVKKFNAILDLAIDALEKNNYEAYTRHILKARQTIESISSSLKHYTKEILRKASIDKAFRIYEHGLSMEKTARLLGISQWELAEYTGQKYGHETKQGRTINVKKRAKLALEFFQ